MLRRGTELVTLTPEIRAFLTAPDPLIVTKANVKTRIHRRDYMDYVGVKIFEAGKVKGELRDRRPLHLDRLHAIGASRSR